MNKMGYKKIIYGALVISFMAAVLVFSVLSGKAAAPVTLLEKSAGPEGDTIFEGVHISEVDVSGMTADEAKEAVKSYLDGIFQTELTFVTTGGNEVKASFYELAPVWNNPDVINEAASYVSKGNVIERYKMHKDMEHNGMVLPLDVGFDDSVLRSFITERCTAYDTPVENASLSRNAGQFVITPGKAGYGVDIDASIELLENGLFAQIQKGETRVELPVSDIQPEEQASELEKVKDVLGTFTTSYSSSGANRSKNVANGCRLVDGTLLYPGDEFSMLEKITPFTEANGYFLAGSYSQGQVVDSLGGGICQVSSTLYNAVLKAELQVTERHNHSMIVNYVDKSADAAIAESSGKNFRFVNNTDYPVYIEGYTENKKITFKVYGVETRPSSHKVEFESEVLSETVPENEVIITDASLPVGYISIQSAHIGYKAKLWKKTYENGVETSREEVNSSVYNATPRTAVVGIAAGDAVFSQSMQAAAASGSIDVCKATVAQLQAQAAAAAAAGITAPEQTTGSVDP